jgi:predicted RNase H-like HicB family nuclease
MAECLIPISIKPLEEGEGYLATSPFLQGLIAQGRTIAETMEIAEDVARKIIESRIEHKESIPESLTSLPTPSKEFEAKIPVPLEA